MLTVSKILVICLWCISELSLVYWSTVCGILVNWKERQWQQTQFSELHWGPKVDIQIDRKWGERPREEIKPEEDASEMK